MQVRKLRHSGTVVMDAALISHVRVGEPTLKLHS